MQGGRRDVFRPSVCQVMENKVHDWGIALFPGRYAAQFLRIIASILEKALYTKSVTYRFVCYLFRARGGYSKRFENDAIILEICARDLSAMMASVSGTVASTLKTT